MVKTGKEKKAMSKKKQERGEIRAGHEEKADACSVCCRNAVYGVKSCGNL